MRVDVRGLLWPRFVFETRAVAKIDRVVAKLSVAAKDIALSEFGLRARLASLRMQLIVGAEFRAMKPAS